LKFEKKHKISKLSVNCGFRDLVGVWWSSCAAWFQQIITLMKLSRLIAVMPQLLKYLTRSAGI